MRDASKPILTKADHQRALAELESLWGSKLGTAAGDRLDMLATQIEAYEVKHYPIGRPSRRQVA